MSILASDVFFDVRAILDDDNSGRYQNEADLVPSINKAIGNIVATFNAAFEQKKISPESLRDLLFTAIVSVTGTTTKKANVTTLMSSLWSILGVDPDPVVTGSPEVLSETRNRWATRSTLEAWNESQADPFSSGTVVSIPVDFVRPAFIGPGHYGGDSSLYILIRPGLIFTADRVAIWYLKNPSRVVNEESIIEFPQSLHNLVVDETLNCLSLQHGPGSAYGKVMDKNIANLVSLMT